jgi:hypothetical protein
MNCDCLKFNEARLIEHYRAHGVMNPRVTEEFLGINFSTGESTISLIYTIRGDNRPFNTQKGKPCHMVASFCPWCGKSVKGNSVDALAVTGA